MRKKSFAAAAIVAASALLVGVGAVPASADSNTLIIWADEKRGPALETFLANKTFLGKKIKIETYASKTALDTALGSATAANGPDIAFTPVGEAVTAAKNGKAADFSLTAASKANFSTDSLAYGQYKGKQVGLPLDIDGVAMIWNKKYGAAPSSLAEFSTKFKAAKSKKTANFGICVTDTAWGLLPVITALGGYHWGTKANGQPNPSDVGVANAAFVANLKTYALGANGKSNGMLKLAGWDVCGPDFIANKGMAVVTGSWNLPNIKGKVDYRITAVPTVSGTGTSKAFAGFGGAYITSFAKTNKKLSAARAAMAYLASPAGSAAYAKAVDRPSPNSAAAARATGDAKAFALALSKTGTPQLDSLLNNKAGGNDYYAVWNDAWDKIFIKGQNPANVLGKAKKVLVKNFVAGAKG